MERKMMSLPAETHAEMMTWLENQERLTGMKITATSFLAQAVKIALGKQVYISIKKEKRGDTFRTVEWKLVDPEEEPAF